MAFLKKLIKSAIGSLQYEKIIQTCYKYISTDMPLTEVMFYATTLFGFDPENDITSYTLPGDVIFDGLSYFVHIPSDTEVLMKEIYSKGIESSDEDE